VAVREKGVGGRGIFYQYGMENRGEWTTRE